MKSEHLFNKQWLRMLQVTPKGKLKLFHFGPSGLEDSFDGAVLSPKHWGKHSYTPKDAATKNVIYFYTNLEDKERVVSGTLYEAKVDLKDLYPFNKDPLNLLDDIEKEQGTENLHHNLQWLYMSERLKSMGYIGMVYKWEDTLLAGIWDEVPVKVSKNTEYNQGVEDMTGGSDIINGVKIPSNDRIGHPIENGLSIDHNLKTRDEKIRRVVATMKHSKKYADEDIILYLQGMNSDIIPRQVDIFEKIVLKPGENGWDKFINLAANAYKEAPDFEQKEVWRWELLNESNYKLWKRLLSKVDITFVTSNDSYKDGDINILDKSYPIRFLERGDPYESQAEMKQDYTDNGSLMITMDFASNHPILSTTDNIVFRAVHDFIVHILADVDFTGLGEIKAYNTHAKLLPPDARPAAFTEVVGQASYFLTFGDFPKQKISLLPGFDYTEIGEVDGYEVVNKELVMLESANNPYLITNPYKNL